MGGFGIGPANPAVEFESDPGLWVRSVAISDGEDTLVLTVIDAEGYLWDYKSKCERCGAKQLAEDLGKDLDIDPSSFVIAATHSHASPDLIGGWGFVPDWYMAQVTDAIKDSISDAVGNMQPARIDVGEVLARGQNSERRDTYRSAEEQQLTWLRATNRETDAVIATVGAYAAHPTTKGTNGGTASSDWVGVFEKTLENRFGGIGMHFMTGLGNMSTSGGTQMGATLAGLVPSKGTVLTDTNVRIEREIWQQPATNVPLTLLGFPGFFDREFLTTPSSIQTGKSPDTAPCLSASPRDGGPHRRPVRADRCARRGVLEPHEHDQGHVGSPRDDAARAGQRRPRLHAPVVRDQPHRPARPRLRGRGSAHRQLRGLLRNRPLHR
jgi:hypothetical protein